MMTTALVIGSAACMSDDITAALELFEPDLIVCANRAGAVLDRPFDHWATYHPENLPGWVAEREAAGLPMTADYWTGWREGKGHRPGIPPGYDFRFINCHRGSSGMLAATIAMVLGHKVVCAGIPLNIDQAHFDDDNPWKDAQNYHKGWRLRYFEMKNVVRSMSGWTSELLGKPTTEWINE